MKKLFLLFALLASTYGFSQHSTCYSVTNVNSGSGLACNYDVTMHFDLLDGSNNIIGSYTVTHTVSIGATVSFCDPFSPAPGYHLGNYTFSGTDGTYSWNFSNSGGTYGGSCQGSGTGGDCHVTVWQNTGSLSFSIHGDCIVH